MQVGFPKKCQGASLLLARQLRREGFGRMLVARRGGCCFIPFLRPSNKSLLEGDLLSALHPSLHKLNSQAVALQSLGCPPSPCLSQHWRKVMSILNYPGAFSRPASWANNCCVVQLRAQSAEEAKSAEGGAQQGAERGGGRDRGRGSSGSQAFWGVRAHKSAEPKLQPMRHGP